MLQIQLHEGRLDVEFQYDAKAHTTFALFSVFGYDGTLVIEFKPDQKDIVRDVKDMIAASVETPEGDAT